MNDFYETLGAVIDEIFGRAIDARAEFKDRNDEVLSALDNPVSYGQVRNYNFELGTIKGRPTRKWFHVVITRLDSGRYELVTYIL